MPSRVGLAAVFLFACGQTDVIADIRGSAGSASEDAGDAGAGDRAAWCSGEAALHAITQDGRETLECASRLAARSFRHAVCVCGTISGPGLLSTTSFETSAGGAPQGGAAVGIGGAGFAGVALPSLQLDGSLTLSGRAPVALAGGAPIVNGDLRSLAPIALAPAAALRVARDARLPAASTFDPAQLSVGRDLYLSPAADDPAQDARWSAARVAGAIAREALTLDPPCPCTEPQLLDVAAMVAFAAGHNDNAELGFAADELSVVAQPTTRALPCGRYYFESLDGTGILSLRIDGPVALFVGDLLAWVEVRLGPQGSLDLFVAGRFEPRGGVLGDRARPAATRVYVHDQPAPGPLPMFGELASNFYAPTVGVQTFGVLRHGSMFVRDLIVSDTLSVRYDDAVTDSGACGAAEGEPCAGPGDCSGALACIAGACARCAADADCGAPLACSAGRCQPVRF